MAARSRLLQGVSRLTLYRRRPRLHVAPVRLRLLAALINIATAILVLGALIAGGAGLIRMTRRLRGQQVAKPVDDLVGRAMEPHEDSERTVELKAFESSGSMETPLARRLQSRTAKLAFAASSFIVALTTEGRQGFAARVLGIRLVDARTGTQISRRQAVVRVGVRTVWQVIAGRLIPRPSAVSAEGDHELRAQMEEARRRYANDIEARNEALMRVYREHKRPAPAVWGCWLRLFARLVLGLAPELAALWSPLRQGLADKLAGTIHIVELPGGVIGRLVARLS